MLTLLRGLHQRCHLFAKVCEPARHQFTLRPRGPRSCYPPFKNCKNVAVARIDNSKGVLPDLIYFVAWSHNGKRIAAVTQEYCDDECAVVMTWDAQTGKHIVFYSDLPVYAIAWSPDNTRFASAIGFSDVQISQVPEYR